MLLMRHGKEVKYFTPKKENSRRKKEYARTVLKVQIKRYHGRLGRK